MRNIDRARSRYKGFTLAESLIAAVVLAASASTIAMGLTASTQNSRNVDQSSTALSLARQLMEDIAARPFSQLSAYNNYSDTSSAMPALADVTTNVTGQDVYVRTAQISFPTTYGSKAFPAGALASVMVTVTSPQQQTVQLFELLTNVDMQLP